jgi:hypothetical protein
MKLNEGDSTDFVSFQLMIRLVSPSENNSDILFQFNADASGASFKTKFLNNQESNCVSGLISGNITSLIYRHKYENKYFEKGQLLKQNSALEFGPDPLKLNSGCKVLGLNALLEGYGNRSDTVIVRIHDYHSPANMIEEQKTVLSIAGISNVRFTLADDESKYYVSINHRNSIETWSKDSALSFHDRFMYYDFTRDSSQAYLFNMKMINGRAHIYSGDVNKDNQVDIIDGSSIDNDVHNYVLGNVTTDLNGDGIVDSSDLIIVDLNMSNYVMARIPGSSSSGISVIKKD